MKTDETEKIIYLIEQRGLIIQLELRGLKGFINYSHDDNCFYGKLDCKDLVTFEGDTLVEVIEGFQYMVDEHVKELKELK